MGTFNSYASNKRVQLGTEDGFYRLLVSGPPVMGATTPLAQGLLIAITGPVTAAGFGTVPLGRLSRAVLAGSGSGNAIRPSLGIQARPVVISSVRANLTFIKQDANIIATWSGSYSLGTTASADANLAAPATDSDILAAQSIGPAVAGVLVAPEAPAVAPTTFNKLWSTTDKINLNMTVLDASITDSTTGNIRVFGFVDFQLALG